MILRDYQHQMLDDTRAALRGHRSVVLQSECGSGKGLITAVIIHGAVNRGKNVLFMVSGTGRVADMDARVSKLNVPHGVLMGGSKRERWHPVQIASIDTLRRMEHMPPADLIVIDECHLGLSPTFRKVLDMYPAAKIIGMSATPMLGSGKALGVNSGGIFEAMVHGPSVTDLIAQGHLVGSRVYAPPAPAELQGLKKKTTGEFDSEQGAAICDNAKVTGDIVAHWKRYASDRKTAAFGFNQKHAFDIAESFRAAGINFAYCDAHTPEGDAHTPNTRQFFWHQMTHGDLMGVASVETISVGWDLPACKALLLCSKTASFPRYRQRLGRGSRPYPGYSDFLVMDHCAGLFEFPEAPYFESVVDWQLDGDPIKAPDGEDKADRIGQCKRPVAIPATGVPASFHGDVVNGYMLCCYHTFKAGPASCPRCGLPLAKEAEAIIASEGELAEVTAEMREKSAKQLASEMRMKLRYLDLVRIGRQSVKRDGTPYSAKWPDVAFRSEFSRWPTRAWKIEAQEMNQ